MPVYFPPHPPRYFRPGFYLSPVCRQPYHFSLLTDVNGVILDKKVSLYLVSLVTAAVNLSQMEFVTCQMYVLA